MNLWSSPDRFEAIKHEGARRSATELLVAEIADMLSVAGQYVARIDLQPTQAIVDFNWTARQAARTLGIRVDVDSRIIYGEGQVEVRVRALSSST